MIISRPEPHTKRPGDAKLVFKGIIFDVYHWEQELYDGTTATFEALKRPDTVDIITVTAEKKILVQKETQPGVAEFLGLPCGRANPDEDVLEAAKRELNEETGFTSEEWELFKAIQQLTKTDWAYYVFIARNARQTNPEHLDAGEKIKLMQVSFDEFLDLAIMPEFRDEPITSVVLRAKLDPQLMLDLKKRLGLI